MERQAMIVVGDMRDDAGDVKGDVGDTTGDGAGYE